MQTKNQISNVILIPAESKLVNTQTVITSSQATKHTSVQPKDKQPAVNATTQAILDLKDNPFYQDKRKWEDSFSAAEIKELSGNIVKAAKDNDGETHVTLQEECTVPTSSHEEESSQESDCTDPHHTKKPGRKPMADKESVSDSDQDPKVKRKVQNRAAQRAFRERKERYVKELETKIKQIQDAHLIITSQLAQENQQLRAIVYRLETENDALRGLSMPLPDLLAPSSDTIAPPNLIQPSLTCLSSSDLMVPTRTFQSSPKKKKKKSRPGACTKKVLPKHHHPRHQAHSNQSSLEYTFSICTPASLKPTTETVSVRSELPEPVQLYPPSVTPRARLQPVQSTDQETSDRLDASIPQSSTTGCQPDDETSLQNLPYPQMEQIESGMLDCHIDSKSPDKTIQLDALIYDHLLNDKGLIPLPMTIATDCLTFSLEQTDDSKQWHRPKTIRKYLDF